MTVEEYIEKTYIYRINPSEKDNKIGVTSYTVITKSKISGRRIWCTFTMSNELLKEEVSSPLKSYIISLVDGADKTLHSEVKND